MRDRPCRLRFLSIFINAPRGPGVHGRIDVTERPFISRNLSVRVHIPLAQHQNELFFCKIGINQSQRNAVEG